MKRITVIAALAIGVIALVVAASGIVVGQSSPHEPAAPAPPPKPTLGLEQGDAGSTEPSPVPTLPPPAPAEPAAPVAPSSPALPPPLTIPATPMTEPAGPQEKPDTPGPVTPAVLKAPADAAVEPAAAQSEDNPTGRQEPSVSIEWVAPPTVKLGQASVFQIVIKNVGTCPATQTVVRGHIPPGVTIKATEPKSITQGDLLVWEMGTLAAQQEKRLDVQMVPDKKGRCTCQATVSFAGSSTVMTQVQQPKLILKAAAPDKTMLGDAANVMLTVSNPGDGTADHVKVKATLSDGLESARGREVEFDLGNLGPNETRSVQVTCATKAGGEQKCEAIATAEGNLISSDAAVFPVLQSKLDLALTGPRVRYLDRQGIYVLKVTNPGNATATNVTIVDQIPQGFKFVDASGGGRHDFTSRSVSWFLGDLPAHQTKEVTLQLMAVNIGEYKHMATAHAARGLQADAEAETRVEGLSAVLVELVDLDDPVEVGANCRYELRVTNTGSKTETNIQVVCTLPDKMELWGAQGPANLHHRVEGKEVIFDSLPKLAPRADAIYRVNTRPTAPGDVRFRARVKADSLAEPVNKEESTKVFGDEASTGAPGTAATPLAPVATPLAPAAVAPPAVTSPAPVVPPAAPASTPSLPAPVPPSPAPLPFPGDGK
jgi:uncharacterized repeat protein (TIGR01451 family)